MSNEQIMARLLSQESKINAEKMLSGILHQNELDRLKIATESISDSSLAIFDDASLSIEKIHNKCKMFNNLGLVIIDYFELISSASKESKKQYENRVQVSAEISRAMKIMAVELNVPVMCLAQLNRDVEYRNDHRPILNDLRERSSLSQDADVVIGLYRDDYYDEKSETPDKVEVIFLKNRHGDKGTVSLGWIPESTTFYELPGQRAWG